MKKQLCDINILTSDKKLLYRLKKSQPVEIDSSDKTFSRLLDNDLVIYQAVIDTESGTYSGIYKCYVTQLGNEYLLYYEDELLKSRKRVLWEILRMICAAILGAVATLVIQGIYR